MRTYKIGRSQNLKEFRGKDARFFNYEHMIGLAKSGFAGCKTFDAERVLIFKNSNSTVEIFAVIQMKVDVNFDSGRCEMGHRLNTAKLSNIYDIQPKFYIRNELCEPVEVKVKFGYGANEYNFDAYLKSSDHIKRTVLDISELEIMVHRAWSGSKCERYPKQLVGYIDAWKKHNDDLNRALAS